jgi:TPR repeat protein
LEPESFFYGEAHFYLGTMLKKGQGPLKNKKEAARHFELAVSYGSEKAQSITMKLSRFIFS